jgi:hypothetical protein
MVRAIWPGTQLVARMQDASKKRAGLLQIFSRRYEPLGVETMALGPQSSVPGF